MVLPLAKSINHPLPQMSPIAGRAKQTFFSLSMTIRLSFNNAHIDRDGYNMRSGSVRTVPN